MNEKVLLARLKHRKDSQRPDSTDLSTIHIVMAKTANSGLCQYLCRRPQRYFFYSETLTMLLQDAG